jgi:hypothetical protein
MDNTRLLVFNMFAKLQYYPPSVLRPAIYKVRLGIDSIVDIFQVYFAAISGIFRIRGLRKHHEIRRYSPDDINDP